MESPSKVGIYLIGYEEKDITNCVLPTNGQMLRYFFYNHNVLGKSVRDSSRCTVRKCLELWKNLKIQTISEDNSIRKLEDLFKEWKNLKEATEQDTYEHLIEEFKFEEKMKQLFNMRAKSMLESLLTGNKFGYMYEELEKDESVAAQISRLKKCKRTLFKKSYRNMGGKIIKI